MNATMKERAHKFTCSQCGKDKTHTSAYTTGYGENDKGEKVCFACCGENDRKHMKETGRGYLYLSFEKDGEYVERRYFSRPTLFRPAIKRETVKLTNWPGTLEIRVPEISVGGHNMAGRRYDVRFSFEGERWYGTTYGDNTQICHVRRYKNQD